MEINRNKGNSNKKVYHHQEMVLLFVRLTVARVPKKQICSWSSDRSEKMICTFRMTKCKCFHNAGGCAALVHLHSQVLTTANVYRIYAKTILFSFCLHMASFNGRLIYIFIFSYISPSSLSLLCIVFVFYCWR